MNKDDSNTAKKRVTPITIRDAARLTGRSPWDIYQRTERGELPFAILHRRRWVAREDVLATIEEGR